MTSGSGNGDRPGSAELVPQEVAELAAQLSETQSPSRRRRLARQITDLAGRSSRASWRGVQVGGRKSAGGLRSGGQTAWTGLQAGGQLAGQRLQRLSRRLTSQMLEMAPKIPVRNIATLRAQYPGRETEELADALIAGAARASAGCGAAVGAATALPFVPTVPVELGVETLALVAVELKLIAELHEVYGMPAPGNRAQRMLAYVLSWADRSGVRVTGSGIAIAVGSPLWRKLERRLAAKAGQSALSLAPLLAGAMAGAMVNHRETRKLGNQVRQDLRRRAAGGS
ncbi:MAG TPA: hypothetical protein VEL03_22955 [Streptosporangiaceae bacterium]|nr:hypothetical protein [Streptosporangiaceae bacterium]